VKIRTAKLTDWELLTKRENDRFGNTETRIYETPDGQLVVIHRNMDGLNAVKQVGDSVEFKITGVRKYGDGGEFGEEVEVEPQHADDDGKRRVGDPTGWVKDAWEREIEEGTFNEHGFKEITSDTAVYEDANEGIVYKLKYTLVSETIRVDGESYEVVSRMFRGRQFPCQIEIGDEVVGFETREGLEEYVRD